MKGFVQRIILGRMAHDMAAGEYGTKLAALYQFLKGRKTIWGGVLFLIGLALTTFGHPAAAAYGASILTLGAVLTSLGLMDKGTDKMPPRFDQGLTEAFAFACSIITIAGKVANGLVLLAQLSGKPWALHISGMMQLAALSATTATGFLATWFTLPSGEAVSVSRFDGRSTLD